jgi:AraC family transcriptional regulator
MTTINLARPRVEDGKPMLIAGLAERHRETNAGIPAQWQRFVPQIGRIPDQIGRTTYGVIFDSLGEGHNYGYLTGVEVADTRKLPDDFGHLEIPAQRYAVFPHEDHVSAIPDTVGAIWREWLPSSRHELLRDGVDFFERYGDGFDPQRGLGDIEIWVPIKA